MNVLDTTKQIFLSEKINDGDRRLIVRSYYTSYLKKLSVEIDKETDKISEKFLNKYYDKHLGKSWNKLVEKYKLRHQDRIEKISQGISMVSNILDVLK